MKQARRHISLRLSISGSIILTVIATSALIGGATIALWRQAMRDELARRMTDVLSVLLAQVDPELHAGLRLPADMEGPAYQELRGRLLAARAAVPDISFLYSYRLPAGGSKPLFVLDSGTPGKDFSALGDVYEGATPTLLESFRPPYRVRVEPRFYADEWGNWLSAFAPILRKDGSLDGVLGMDMAASYVSELERRLVATLLGIAAAITLAMVLLSVLIARGIARPLLVLSSDMAGIARLQLDSVVSVRSGIREVIQMEETLENMKKGLRSFRKYVPADLVSQLIGMRQEAILGMRRQELSIFFCDLANFTSHSERLPPEELTGLMTDYFVAVTAALQAEGATVDKFIGDAIMAFWNAPLPLADHGLRALRAGLAAREAFSAAMAGRSTEGVPALEVRVGLATGEVMVGNMGHEGRLSYTAIGDAVNLASRLESLNKLYGTGILVAEETLKSAGTELRHRPVDKVAVKGKQRGITISEIARVAPPWWDDYRAAWAAYGAGDWLAPARASRSWPRHPASWTGPRGSSPRVARPFSSAGPPRAGTAPG